MSEQVQTSDRYRNLVAAAHTNLARLQPPVYSRPSTEPANR